MKAPLDPQRLDQAIHATAAAFDVPVRGLLSRARSARIGRARLALYTALYRALDTTLMEIGAALGRDHTTVRDGIKAADAYARQDGDYAAALERLHEQVGR